MIGPIPLRRVAPPLRWFVSQAVRLLHPNATPNTDTSIPEFLRAEVQSSGGPPPNLPVHPFDLRHGTDTGGFIDGADLGTGHPHDRYNTAYYAMSPSRFERCLGRWRSDAAPGSVERYSFVDLGSGKGRALLLASVMPFRQVVGVELHAELARISRVNAAKWERQGRAMSPISVYCQDATDFRFPPGPCLLYLFHPFGTPVLERLLSGLAEQFETRPGALDLLYFNPEGGDRIELHPGFKRLWTEVLPISGEDGVGDALANDGDLCSAYRWIGTQIA